MAKFRIGIIGFGKIARDQHLPAILASDDFELAGVANPAAEGAAPGVPVFSTYTEMLKALPALDAVSLCTPPGPRRLIAAQCLQAGKHVLVEKPPAATVAEVSDMAAHAQAVRRVLFATYHAQHNAAVKMAAEALAGKTVTHLDVTWKEDIRKWHPGQDWILAEGGFGIFDPGINALSILTRILPEALFVHAAALEFPANRQAPIAADLTFALGEIAGDALKASFDWRWNGTEVWEIEVGTSDGMQLKLKLTIGGSQIDIQGRQPFASSANEYPDIYREFGQLLKNGTSKADIAPFQLVADAFMIGRRTMVDAFEF